jgi:hypothetical protein
MTTPGIVVSGAKIVAFVADPLMGGLGLLMLCFPKGWAKMNARAARRELRDFDSPKQLAQTRRLGILFMIFAAFSLLSMLFVIARLI